MDSAVCGILAPEKKVPQKQGPISTFAKNPGPFGLLWPPACSFKYGPCFEQPAPETPRGFAPTSQQPPEAPGLSRGAPLGDFE